MTNPVLLGGEPGQNVQRPAGRNKRKKKRGSPRGFYAIPGGRLWGVGLSAIVTYAWKGREPAGFCALITMPLTPGAEVPGVSSQWPGWRIFGRSQVAAPDCPNAIRATMLIRRVAV
jgi:hypothetical protein